MPKPFTPFQWFGMNTEEELRRKVNLLRDAARHARGVQLKWHDPKASLIEGLVSRGDRRLGPVIEHVWRAGGTFQEWSEHFRLDLWEAAMAEHGLDMDWYCHRHRTEDEVLPWDHLSAGLHKDFLWQDWRDALDELGLEDCRWTPCYDCGACTGYGIEHVVASAVPPAGGQPGHRTGPGLRRARRALAPQACGGRSVKVRVRFEKRGKIRFLSHRDLARIWERSLRRAGISVAYSEGFSPRPRLHFGLALSTGHESLAEYLDVDLAPDADVGVEDLADRVNPHLPVRDGRHRGGARAAGHRLAPAGRHQLVLAARGGRPRPSPRRGDDRTGPGPRQPPDRRRAQGQPRRARRPPGHPGPRPRPCVGDGPDPDATPLRPSSMLLAELATQPRSLRPAELVRALDPTWVEGRVLRTHQWTLVDGARLEPIPLPEGGPRGATSTPHAHERAS